MTATGLGLSRLSKTIIKVFIGAGILMFIAYTISDHNILQRIEMLERITRAEEAAPLTIVSKNNGFLLKEGDHFMHDFENKNFNFKNFKHLISEYSRLFKTNCMCNKMVVGDLYTDGYKIGCLDFFEKQKQNGEKCIVYSLGSDGNYVYESAIHNQFGCEIHTFDKNKFDLPGYIKFQQATIGSCPECTSINTLLKNNNHTYTPINAFKIDIEGAEWDNLPDIFNENFQQIQMEVHSSNFDRLKMLDNFSDNWCLADVNPNILSRDCLELLFVNKRFVDI
ncbi:hypothetical protein K501DRAFT_279440 [Backusella circina FSU 941]|nr:hypothetical protein K501DRAFT_279440 [Backusella circina FSU 941]